MKAPWWMICATFVWQPLPAQPLPTQPPNAQMNAKEVDALCTRAAQLMDAGGVASPDLGRAAGPVIENVKQACTLLKVHPNGGQPTYMLMMNIRAYLELADAIPKPYPFPDIARQQLAEVRDQAGRLEAHFRALLDRKDVELVATDINDLARYADADQKTAPPQTGRPRVVFLGDSITDLWRLNEYFPDRDFINRGISGQMAAQMLARMKADVIDLHPAAVVIQAGTDDLGRHTPLTDIEDDYLMMADVASASKIKVVFASVLPVNDYHRDADPAYERTPSHPPEFIHALNDWLKTFCAQRGYLFLDYSAALVDSSGALISDLSDDGLHPNAKGYRTMTPLLTSALNRVLAPAAQALAPAAPANRVESGKTSKTGKGK